MCVSSKHCQHRTNNKILENPPVLNHKKTENQIRFLRQLDFISSFFFFEVVCLLSRRTEHVQLTEKSCLENCDLGDWESSQTETLTISWLFTHSVNVIVVKAYYSYNFETPVYVSGIIKDKKQSI